MQLNLLEIAQHLGARHTIERDQVVTSVEFDSRKVQVGSLFVAISQGVRDGHEFVETAMMKGAFAVISERAVDAPYILVEDSVQALQQLAAYYRDKQAVDVIAITGSNGKTTTKDMVASVLSAKYKTYKTQGNYNNELGMPYTILHMPDKTEKLVLEMGQDHLGDIHLLSMIAKPKLAIVTMVGEAHLAFFDNQAQIAQGKLQIVDGMSDDGLLLAPVDRLLDPYLPSKQAVKRFGESGEIQVSDIVESKDQLRFRTNFLTEPIVLNIPGKFNAYNALVAAYVGYHYGIDQDSILARLANFDLTKGRTQWQKASNGADLLNDSYNANPTSMRLILDTFKGVESPDHGKKIAVLADMKELGDNSVTLHSQLITSLSPDWCDELYFYGEDIAQLAAYATDMWPKDKVHYYRKTADIDEHNGLIFDLLSRVEPHDMVLFKGSNSMRLGEVIAALSEKGDKHDMVIN